MVKAIDQLGDTNDPAALGMPKERRNCLDTRAHHSVR